MKLNNQKEDLPTPITGAVFYEDENTYACLANFPIVPGHVVVVWKNKVSDLHFLNNEDYGNLMETVDKVRNAMLKTFHTNKVYLFYMDEIKHVHWHLLPRTTGNKGFTLVRHKPKVLKDLSQANQLKANI